MVTQKVFRSA